MIIVNESGCGCSVRTGTLITLWTTLVFDGIRVLLYLGKIIYDPSYSYFKGNTALFTIFLDTIFLTACIFGMVVSTLGIYAIQKNRQDYLNLCYYYYLAYVGYWLFIVLVVVVYPSAFFDVTIFSPLHYLVPYDGVARYALVYALGYLFVAVITAYAAIIIKSCKEAMKTNPTVGFDPEMSDPTEIGYSCSI